MGEKKARKATTVVTIPPPLAFLLFETKVLEV